MIAGFSMRGYTVMVLTIFSYLNIAAQQPTRFQLQPGLQTGITFRNTLTESDSLNILAQANIYNGGGVGIGDFNGDGLPDVYLAGNMVPNKLYLNKGAFKFDDITDKAGVGGSGRWCTGVSVADINADGWPDIYVSASFRSDALRRTNLLYIHQGLDAAGMPQFKESAKAYGLADAGFSTQGLFFDYDRDGDLDMYLVTNELNDPKTPIIYRPKVKDGSAKNTDRLYRNNGNNTFTNVSKAAGITIEGWGHAACISDFNGDGWPDVYVANDFISNDLLYINNRNGTFSDKLGEFFKHTGWNAMGTDVADINNDGYPDLISLEMLPETNLRKKTMLRGDEYYNYFNSKQFGYTHQYVRNVLQLNSGPVPGGHPVFSDVAFMSGVYQTDWSWAPLVADFDNDGLRDIIITNGLPRDVTDLDYVSYNSGQGGQGGRFTLGMVDSLPVVEIPDYAFKNKGSGMFEDQTAAWGFGKPSFSNGAVYADLDNDGDLDVIVNNLNEEAFVYENAAARKEHYLKLQFKGLAKNTGGIGAAVRLFYNNGQQQYYEHQPCRGYLSTQDSRAHFGLGTTTIVDSIKVVWSNGAAQTITGVAVDTTLVLEESSASLQKKTAPTPTPLFTKAPDNLGINFIRTEKDAIDYNIQPTLPHKLSQFGPGIAAGDIDGNGFDDFYVSGTTGNGGVFYLQNSNGTFTKDASRLPVNEAGTAEENGVLLFDADGDADLDLYVVCGSYEFPRYHPSAQDKLFLNDGKGIFTRAAAALTKEFTNGSCVKAADFDGDGDLDLFVGGRSVSGAYPQIPESYLLQNDGGVFRDVTLQYCPQLQYAGMVSDALWSDFDGDGKVDLVVAGEWMPVSFFKNSGTTFEPVTSTGVEQQTGWWNSLAGGDFDGDGDIDYIAGNLGLNSHFKGTTEEPMTLLAKDLDENGKIDLMLFCYLKAADGSRKPFPMHAKDDMVSQLVSTRRKYPTYKAYGMADIDHIWPAALRNDAVQLQATNMQSCYIENKGGGRFEIKPLPLPAQAAPLFGLAARDVDGDGALDVAIVGNDWGMEPGSGRHDALNGLFLKGDGQGNFNTKTVQESGFFVKGDAKSLVTLASAKGLNIFISGQNGDSLVVHTTVAPNGKWITLQPQDFSAEITYKDGRKKRQEFYYGDTFLSQSSRRIMLPPSVQQVMIKDFKGAERTVKF